MNIIPEEPEQYVEIPRPTPGLSTLLSSKQFHYYSKANASKLFGCLKVNYQKRVISDIKTKPKEITKALKPTLAMNQKSLVYIGIGFGILAITKLLKTLSNNP
ncbi:hypothetical protein SteCoe_26530 [Stentor coeruleus]|uniref:Uncharacterized protein n=1 Tax=Stentor coeruleus TaxID=5963 RepID=A0A1R2BCM7_9CILI|nr:hypothetical protein SteCoe_26530 [Stentor coeruleus]